MTLRQPSYNPEMTPRAPILLLCLASLLTAAKHPQKIAEGQSSDAVVSLQATIYADPETVLQAVGNDLQGHYIVVRVTLTPRAGKITPQLDDFLLRTDKDGERSHPFVPSQIAGQGSLVITETDAGGGGAKAENSPTFGIGGMGMGGGGVGTSPAMKGNKAKMENSDKKDPLQDLLTAKMLPEKETDQPVSGLLYFPMEKQKVKDLELIYTTSAGKLSVRFK
jgi:hypothetical protein